MWRKSRSRDRRARPGTCAVPSFVIDDLRPHRPGTRRLSARHEPRGGEVEAEAQSALQTADEKLLIGERAARVNAQQLVEIVVFQYCILQECTHGKKVEEGDH